MQSIADLRKDYKMRTLLEADVAADPVEQFSKWWDDALKSGIEEVNAMTLATADSNAMPSARIVLLKDFSKDGFVFFTNYNSHKGQELATNPWACLVFFWKELERQVRISGKVKKVSTEASDEYFASRPEGSRLGAWASPQSSVIGSREIIEENVAAYRREYDDADIPRPPHWGGYIVIPGIIEFWQGRSDRLHDRIQYGLTEEGGWKIERLAP
ncbi:MAG TPA: pyridoxamine 5'-phosphate oxidase [Ferruginibacter sp.]|nr:pyridoxamine 5'-phosphate oxidase [Ferruginibacter sp.]